MDIDHSLSAMVELEKFRINQIIRVNHSTKVQYYLFINVLLFYFMNLCDFHNKEICLRFCKSLNNADWPNFTWDYSTDFNKVRRLVPCKIQPISDLQKR